MLFFSCKVLFSFPSNTILWTVCCKLNHLSLIVPPSHPFSLDKLINPWHLFHPFLVFFVIWAAVSYPSSNESFTDVFFFPLKWWNIFCFMYGLCSSNTSNSTKKKTESKTVTDAQLQVSSLTYGLYSSKRDRKSVV